MLRVRTAFLCGILALGALLPRTALAGQPRDYVVGAQPEGTTAELNVMWPGVWGKVLNRRNIYGKANQLTLHGGAMVTWPFAEGEVGADLRLIVLTVGGSIGYRNTWRNFTFDQNDPITRAERRERGYAGEFDNQMIPWAEGRAQLALPFNDFVVFNNVAQFRQEWRDLSFDWRQGIVADGGFRLYNNTQLWFKHKDWGGIAPMLQYLNYPLYGQREELLNLGLMAITRPGFVRRNDLLFARVFVNLSGSDVYGVHIYRAPVTLTLGYRTTLKL